MRRYQNDPQNDKQAYQLTEACSNVSQNTDGLRLLADRSSLWPPKTGQLTARREAGVGAQERSVILESERSGGNESEEEDGWAKHMLLRVGIPERIVDQTTYSAKPTRI